MRARWADIPPITGAFGLDAKDLLAHSFGIDGLVQIDPQYAGKECDGWRERQEQHDGPQDDFRHPPAGQKPKQDGDWRHDQDAQAETEVHGAEKVAWFPLKLEVTDATAFAHLRESAENGIAKDSAHSATGAALLKNAPQG